MLYIGIISIFTLALILKDNISNSRYNNYPSGYELKRQLRDIEIYDIETYLINYDLIEEQIFKEYVFDYEMNHGYSREISLRKALKRYIEVFKIYN